jgi:hypothetical protein
VLREDTSEQSRLDQDDLVEQLVMPGVLEQGAELVALPRRRDDIALPLVQLDRSRGPLAGFLRAAGRAVEVGQRDQRVAAEFEAVSRLGELERLLRDRLDLITRLLCPPCGRLGDPRRDLRKGVSALQLLAAVPGELACLSSIAAFGEDTSELGCGPADVADVAQRAEAVERVAENTLQRFGRSIVFFGQPGGMRGDERGTEEEW